MVLVTEYSYSLQIHPPCKEAERKIIDSAGIEKNSFIGGKLTLRTLIALEDFELFEALGKQESQLTFDRYFLTRERQQV